MTSRPRDPLEQIVADALDRAGIRHEVGFIGERGETSLDFHLPDHGLYIEVKRAHTERIAKQTARAENIVVVQGEASVRWLAELLTRASTTA